MASGSAGPCPDRNLLGGFAEGRLLREETESVENHLAGCDGCRAVVRGLDFAAPPVRRVPVRALAVAAAVLLALGGALLLRSGPGTEERLAAAAAGLGASHPDLRDDLRLLDRKERLRREKVLRGTTLRAMEPAGTILDPRPAFRWTGAAGEVRIALAGPGGVVLWTGDGRGGRLDFPAAQPALRPGLTYTWTVEAAGPLGPEQSPRAFTLAADAERSRFEEAIRRIDAGAPADLADLLKAGLALRRGFSAEAVKCARRAADADPSDPVRRELLFQSLERTQSPEADRWFPADAGE